MKIGNLGTKTFRELESQFQSFQKSNLAEKISQTFKND